MRRFIFLFSITLLLTLSGFFIYRHFYPPTLLSPLTSLLSPLSDVLGLSTPVKKTDKIIYGFLPYWNFKEVKNLHFNLITHLAYFGLDFDEGGNIIKTTDDGYTEPGWSNLNSEAASRIFRQTKSSSGKTIIVMRAMTQSVIESIVNSPARRQKVINNTLAVMSAKNFDGINLDFEYAGTPDTKTRNNFSIFVKELSTTCKLKNPLCEIDIDVFADSATHYRIWNFSEIGPYVDRVIVMAYDFFRSSSTQAGPVAPLRGACVGSPKLSAKVADNCLDYDVSQSIAEFSKIISPQKILLGVPYYGYQWRTASSNTLANTYPDSGQIATFKRIQTILAQKDTPPQTKSLPAGRQVYGIQSYWDNNTFSTRLVFEDPPGYIQQIHYDDERALSLKYDLVNQTSLGGIAIWALGYDGDYPNLWQLLEQKFFTP